MASELLFDWLKSYLCDRRKRAAISHTISAGCSQGSVLWPLLAFKYLDRLSGRTKIDILFFADDTSHHASHTTVDIYYHCITTSTKYANMVDNGQSLLAHQSLTNISTLTPTRSIGTYLLGWHNTCTYMTTTTSHLGMIFSWDLRFHHHVNATCSKGPLYPITQYILRPAANQIPPTSPHYWDNIWR